MHEYAVGEEVEAVGPYATKDVRGTVQVLPQGERVFYRRRPWWPRGATIISKGYSDTPWVLFVAR